MNVIPVFATISIAVLLRFGVVIAPEDDFCVHRLHRVNLDFRSRARHHDDGLEPQFLSSQRDALRMVAGACRNHSAVALGLREFRDLVVGAAELEAEDGLLVFALQPDVVVQAVATDAAQTRAEFLARLRRRGWSAFHAAVRSGWGCSRGTHSRHCTRFRTGRRIGRALHESRRVAEGRVTPSGQVSQ